MGFKAKIVAIGIWGPPAAREGARWLRCAERER
jgi:hypothetical protein